MPETVLVIGESIVDIVAGPDGAVSEHPGGSPANVAVGLVRLGADVQLATAYADDRLGALLDEHFERAGVALVADPHHLMRTPTAVATLDSTGAATYEFDLTWELGVLAPGHQPVLVHTGSIAAVLSPGADQVADVISSMEQSATVSYDINARPGITGSGATLVAQVERMVGLSDVVKASDEDLEVLYPGAKLDEAAERLLGLGPCVIVITEGGGGASAFTRTDRVSVAAEKVEVADTIGAGDSFCAALLDGLRRRGLLGASNRPALRELPSSGWAELMQRANRAAAITVSRPGADPPTEDELDG